MPADDYAADDERVVDIIRRAASRPMPCRRRDGAANRCAMMHSTTSMRIESTMPSPIARDIKAELRHCVRIMRDCLTDAPLASPEAYFPRTLINKHLRRESTPVSGRDVILIYLSTCRQHMTDTAILMKLRGMAPPRW